MKPDASYQKLRGGYYTPSIIADFLAKWAIRSNADSILEPSCGDGSFLRSSVSVMKSLGAASGRICACEIDEEEAAKAKAFLKNQNFRSAEVILGDFFSSSLHGGEKFDVVLGNPPFVRFQNFPESQRLRAFDLMAKAGLKANRLTNSWVPFVVATALLLKESGRLAMVLPAELLQVSYAADLRLFLSNYFPQITIIAFRSLAFAGIQQETILLLASRLRNGHNGIEVVELADPTELEFLDANGIRHLSRKEIDHEREKWTKYFLSQKQIDLLRELRKSESIPVLQDFASTDVGVVTGLNEVFVLTELASKSLQLTEFTVPIVGRSAHLAGVIFTEEDFQHNARASYPVRLLRLKGGEPELNPSLQSYLDGVAARKLNNGFKCRNRKYWYAVPSIYPADAFLLRQIHQFPKLTLNRTAATSTDTIHRLRFKSNVNREHVAVSFHNSMTFAFSEIYGRSYGGGVLELEPSEADLLPIPIRNARNLDLAALDNHMRSGRIESILEQHDDQLLVSGLGLSRRDVLLLRNSWHTLKQRRLTRKKARNPIPYVAEGPHTSPSMQH